MVCEVCVVCVRERDREVFSRSRTVVCFGGGAASILGENVFLFLFYLVIFFIFQLLLQLVGVIVINENSLDVAG